MPFKGWKTILTNGLVMIYAVVEAVTGEAILMDDQTAITAGALALCNFILRFATSTPVGGK
jgi:hypothetical protein